MVDRPYPVSSCCVMHGEDPHPSVGLGIIRVAGDRSYSGWGGIVDKYHMLRVCPVV